MNQIQEKLLEILKWFDFFARANGLRYYAIGGTMLGAYRHKGFIPWDDDIDVGMPRPDYEKFIELMNKSNEKRFVVETPLSPEKKFLYSVTKIYDTTTTAVEKTKQKLVRGLWLDIFPLDGIGLTVDDSKKHLKKITHYNLVLTTRTATLRKSRSFFKNAAIVVSNCVPDFIFRPKRVQLKLEQVRKAVSWDEANYCGNTIGYGEKEIIKKDIWGTPTEYSFEGIKIFGPEKPEEYLTSIYGKWNVLPPENKRLSGHDFELIDLEKSYLERGNS